MFGLSILCQYLLNVYGHSFIPARCASEKSLALFYLCEEYLPKLMSKKMHWICRKSFPLPTLPLYFTTIPLLLHPIHTLPTPFISVAGRLVTQPTSLTHALAIEWISYSLFIYSLPFAMDITPFLFSLFSPLYAITCLLFCTYFCPTLAVGASRLAG
jgi:hypothetical protein